LLDSASWLLYPKQRLRPASPSASLLTVLGYDDSAPYGCAPTGYCGPEWFNGDGFIGAGPWFLGASDFQGNVNNRLHPEHGYKGPAPKAGEKAEPSKRIDSAHFQGNEARDGRGHVAGQK
jgi:hypothetical protein